MPRRVVIAGGGYIAPEFARVFHGLGAQVPLVCRGALMLRGFDIDLRTRLGQEIRKSGVAVHVGKEVLRIDRLLDHLVVHLNDGRDMAADGIFFATGRRPNIEWLGIGAVGIAIGVEGAIVVDDDQAAGVATIHAVDDLANRVNLTPVAIAMRWRTGCLVTCRVAFPTRASRPSFSRTRLSAGSG